MKRTILVLIVGLLVGAAGAIYFLGARSRGLAGIPIKPPDHSQDTSGSVTVSVDEKFFESLLGTVFQKLGPPQLKLSQTDFQSPMRPAMFQAACNNAIAVTQDRSDVKTGVRFTGGKINAPIAFKGTYSVLGRCTEFSGWARTSVDLSFDQPKQTVFGQVNIDEITLDNTPAVISTFITAFVRRTINEKVNPFEVLKVSQLALSVPIQASGGSLKANVKDVRAEVLEGSLRLSLVYDFSAERNAG